MGEPGRRRAGARRSAHPRGDGDRRRPDPDAPTGGAAPLSLETLVTGTGSPATLVLHGLAGSIPEARPLASGISGTRVLVALPGHGASPPPPRWTYAALADALEPVALGHGVTRGVGVSLGAGTLLAALAAGAPWLERVVLVLPACVDRPRRDAALSRLDALAAAVRSGDAVEVAAQALLDVPAAFRDKAEARVWARGRAERMLASSAVADALRTLPAEVPVADAAALATVAAEVLVVAERGDPLHPLEEAERAAALLPRARLHVFGEPGALWWARRELRALVAGFLAAG